ncbi:SPP2 [Candida margitis]|uniref:SPP2 n=1 Tax=Candida margitis TaxID=1775924 RepID=UPI0022264641|nr:SPP2 [Candida margitis]KAI5963955.1 SPP2 [Candida margitis]
MSSGFKINLKKKAGPKKILQAEATDESKKLIDSYTASDTQEKELKEWVIEPKKISRSIVQQQQPRKEKQPREELKYGVTTFEKSEPAQQGSVIRKLTYESDSDSEDDDKKIPVEEFGAAFLRGLGWNGKKDDTDSYDKDVKNRQRGVTLGIGAKPIDNDLARELHNKAGEVPLVKRRKKS